MKLGGTTDIKFVRPKQTRHLFCLGRFLFSDLHLIASWNMNSPFAELTGLLLFSFANLSKNISVTCDLVKNI